MRSWLLKFALLSIFTLLMLAMHAPGQVNPHTNIKWPPCPPGSSVYNIVTNQCMPNGTAANPAGAAGQLQRNLSGAFAGFGQLDINSNINFSLNTQINVKDYGAVGDCIADDHNAIFAAQAAAKNFALGGQQFPAVLYFPKSSANFGCYLTSTIEWTGVPIVGQPAGWGVIGGASGVVLRGKAGQDILHVADPSTSGSLFPVYGAWTIQDITFEVDASTPGSFPHRWPGRWFDDTTTTNGSAVIQTNAGEISCGDVGQAIQINGAGAAGGNLVTTITSVVPCWNATDAGPGPTHAGWKVVTLAANAQASLTNAHTYISLLGLPVTQHIGNCAIAMDMMDALAADWPQPTQKWGFSSDILHNVLFQAVFTGGTTNGGCGWYSQGGWTPYQFDVRNANFYGLEFGVVEGTAELNSKQVASGNDYQSWDHVWMFGDMYPWITYNGGGNQLTKWQQSSASGPQILGVGNLPGDVEAGWLIDTGNMEITGPNTGYGMRIEGAAHILQGPSLAAPGQTGAIYASDTTGIASASGSIVVGGTNNRFYLGGGSVSNSVITDVGMGNAFWGTYNGSGGFGRIQTSYPIAMLPFKGEGQMVGRVTSDFVRDGNIGTPYNSNDLLFWAKDFTIEPGPATVPLWSNLIYPDTNSPSGAEFAFTSNTFVLNFSTLPFSQSLAGRMVTVGTNLPAGRATISYMAKCLNPIVSFTFNVKSSAGTTLLSDTHACNTTLQTYSARVDFSSVSGQQVGFIGGTANQVLIAWAAIRPDAADVNGKTIPGAGAAITTGPATSVLHNCPWFTDTLGTLGDSGSGCGAAGGGIADIQITTGTTAIPGNSCTANTATAMTGLLTTSAIVPPTPTSSTTGVVGWGSSGGLGFSYFPQAGIFNWSVCNPTAVSITPGGSLTWNVGAR
jgi:hypothetical protein